MAGDEEKGFSDVVLDGMVVFSSKYVRSVVSIILTESKCAAVEITDFVARFRAYGDLPSAAISPDHRACFRNTADSS
jgi:hypothetical protein